MYGGQEKILGQKVNVKFFTVDPYVGGAGLPRPFSKFANYWKNIFLKIKTSKIKSEKNIYQTIHNTGFIFYFFGIFTIFLYFSRFFTKKIFFLTNIWWRAFNTGWWIFPIIIKSIQHSSAPELGPARTLVRRIASGWDLSVLILSIFASRLGL